MKVSYPTDKQVQEQSLWTSRHLRRRVHHRRPPNPYNPGLRKEQYHIQNDTDSCHISWGNIWLGLTVPLSQLTPSCIEKERPYFCAWQILFIHHTHILSLTNIAYFKTGNLPLFVIGVPTPGCGRIVPAAIGLSKRYNRTLEG